jgi:hypothetical protein
MAILLLILFALFLAGTLFGGGEDGMDEFERQNERDDRDRAWHQWRDHH